MIVYLTIIFLEQRSRSSRIDANADGAGPTGPTRIAGPTRTARAAAQIILGRKTNS